jgi:hypothetical protein
MVCSKNPDMWVLLVIKPTSAKKAMKTQSRRRDPQLDSMDDSILLFYTACRMINHR